MWLGSCRLRISVSIVVMLGNNKLYYALILSQDIVKWDHHGRQLKAWNQMVWAVVVKQSFNCHLDDEEEDDDGDDDDDDGCHCEKSFHLPFPQ